MWSTEEENTARCNISQGNIWIVPQLMLKLTYIGKIFTCGIVNKLLDRISFEVEILKEKKKKKSSPFFKEDSIHRTLLFWQLWVVYHSGVNEERNQQRELYKTICMRSFKHPCICRCISHKCFCLAQVTFQISRTKVVFSSFVSWHILFFSIKMEFD